MFTRRVSEASLVERALALLFEREDTIALEQNQRLLQQIRSGELHPIMAAFGLWRDEAELASLGEEITENRQNQPVRPTIEI